MLMMSLHVTSSMTWTPALPAQASAPRRADARPVGRETEFSAGQEVAQAVPRGNRMKSHASTCRWFAGLHSVHHVLSCMTCTHHVTQRMRDAGREAWDAPQRNVTKTKGFPRMRLRPRGRPKEELSKRGRDSPVFAHQRNKNVHCFKIPT